MMKSIRGIALLSVLSLLLLGLGVAAQAREGSKAKAQRSTTATSPKSAQHEGLTATLVDQQKKAEEKAATVQVKVNGVKLTDPAAVHERAQQGEGHLHYQVDNGPVIATTATKLSFHDLPSGQHHITVMLAGNDHSPLGPEESLNVTIP
jgi:hypothetical protein